MNITGQTRICAIVADPIQQVKAPQLINGWVAEHGVDAVLVPMHVRPSDLAAWASTMRSIENLCGFIVTVPHKIAMRELCDEVSPAAEVVGAVNVVRRHPDGRLVGDILDGEGFVAGLRRSGLEPRGMRVLLCGGGGAANAIAFALAQAGVAELAIYNRTTAKVEALIDRLRPHYPQLTLTVASASPAGFDLVVNATSLGMSETDPLPFQAHELVAKQVVAEIIMKPTVTPILAIAQSKACTVQFGLPMLECQIDLLAKFMGLAQL